MPKGHGGKGVAVEKKRPDGGADKNPFVVASGAGDGYARPQGAGRISCSAKEVAGMKRRISISYDFRPDEPGEGQGAQIQQAFAELGWAVTYYGGGSSNVHRCYIDIESDDRDLDRPTLIATLVRLGIPVGGDTSIHGDLEA
jgi:hypothetical protein